MDMGMSPLTANFPSMGLSGISSEPTFSSFSSNANPLGLNSAGSGLGHLGGSNYSGSGFGQQQQQQKQQQQQSGHHAQQAQNDGNAGFGKFSEMNSFGMPQLDLNISTGSTMQGVGIGGIGTFDSNVPLGMGSQNGLGQPLGGHSNDAIGNPGMGNTLFGSNLGSFGSSLFGSSGMTQVPSLGANPLAPGAQHDQQLNGLQNQMAARVPVQGLSSQDMHSMQPQLGIQAQQVNVPSSTSTRHSSNSNEFSRGVSDSITSDGNNSSRDQSIEMPSNSSLTSKGQKSAEKKEKNDISDSLGSKSTFARDLKEREREKMNLPACVDSAEQVRKNMNCVDRSMQWLDLSSGISATLDILYPDLRVDRGSTMLLEQLLNVVFRLIVKQHYLRYHTFVQQALDQRTHSGNRKSDVAADIRRQVAAAIVGFIQQVGGRSAYHASPGALATVIAVNSGDFCPSSLRSRKFPTLGWWRLRAAPNKHWRSACDQIRSVLLRSAELSSETMGQRDKGTSEAVGSALLPGSQYITYVLEVLICEILGVAGGMAREVGAAAITVPLLKATMGLGTELLHVERKHINVCTKMMRKQSKQHRGKKDEKIPTNTNDSVVDVCVDLPLLLPLLDEGRLGSVRAPTTKLNAWGNQGGVSLASRLKTDGIQGMGGSGSFSAVFETNGAYNGINGRDGRAAVEARMLISGSSFGEGMREETPAVAVCRDEQVRLILDAMSCSSSGVVGFTVENMPAGAASGGLIKKPASDPTLMDAAFPDFRTNSATFHKLDDCTAWAKTGARARGKADVAVAPGSMFAGSPLLQTSNTLMTCAVAVADVSSVPRTLSAEHAAAVKAAMAVDKELKEALLESTGYDNAMPSSSLLQNDTFGRGLFSDKAAAAAAAADAAVEAMGDVPVMVSRDMHTGSLSSDERSGGVGGGHAGFVFLCDNSTYKETINRGLFGLPVVSKDGKVNLFEEMKSITPSTKLFLFNFSLREDKSRCVHGVWTADCAVNLNIDPSAWAGNSNNNGNDFSQDDSHVRYTSRFPAQIRVTQRENTQVYLTKEYFKAGPLSLEKTVELLQRMNAKTSFTIPVPIAPSTLRSMSRNIGGLRSREKATKIAPSLTNASSIDHQKVAYRLRLTTDVLRHWLMRNNGKDLEAGTDAPKQGSGMGAASSSGSGGLDERAGDNQNWSFSGGVVDPIIPSIPNADSLTESAARRLIASAKSGHDLTLLSIAAIGLQDSENERSEANSAKSSNGSAGHNPWGNGDESSDAEGDVVSSKITQAFIDAERSKVLTSPPEELIMEAARDLSLQCKLASLHVARAQRVSAASLLSADVKGDIKPGKGKRGKGNGEVSMQVEGWGDSSLGVTRSWGERMHPTRGREVFVCWKHVRLSIWHRDLNALVNAYTALGFDPRKGLTRVFCMLQRYKTLERLQLGTSTTAVTANPDVVLALEDEDRMNDKAELDQSDLSKYVMNVYKALSRGFGVRAPGGGFTLSPLSSIMRSLDLTALASASAEGNRGGKNNRKRDRYTESFNSDGKAFEMSRSFCTLWPFADVDRFFGSYGCFYNFRPDVIVKNTHAQSQAEDDGQAKIPASIVERRKIALALSIADPTKKGLSFYVTPPFDIASIEGTLGHCVAVVAASNHANALEKEKSGRGHGAKGASGLAPISFIVVAPETLGFDPQREVPGFRRWCRFEEKHVKIRTHFLAISSSTAGDGGKIAREEEKQRTTASIYWIQNDAGNAVWPPHAEHVKSLVQVLEL
jgi:hypothetical protein